MNPVIAVLVATGAFLAAALMHARQAPTDLEVGTGQFISYQELLRLPQVSFTTSGDDNFPVPAQVSGISLDDLRHSLDPGANTVVAICADGYHGSYSAAYVQAHHPVLVLTVNGKAQDGWPKTHNGIELGPYVISNPGFTPSFKVLSHSDEAQIPFQVVRLEFRDEHEVFGGIAPQGGFAAGSPVMNGYKIAQQNCFRCHNQGAEGGQMAHIPWPLLGSLAKGSPEFFARYVRNPQALNAHSKMAPSPQYDDQTMAALEAYFSTFAAGGH
jgi:hypothetical protein